MQTSKRLLKKFIKCRKKTNSVVSIGERFEKKGYHQCTVEAYHCFSDMGFNSYQFTLFINTQIWKQ